MSCKGQLLASEEARAPFQPYALNPQPYTPNPKPKRHSPWHQSRRSHVQFQTPMRTIPYTQSPQWKPH